MFLANDNATLQQNISPFIAQIGRTFEDQTDQLRKTDDKKEIRRDRDQPG